MEPGGRRKGWNQTGTASAIVLRPLRKYCKAHGNSIDGFLSDLGIPAPWLEDIDRRIPEASRCRAWEHASSLSNDPLLGIHVAETAHIGSFDVLDYALYFSTTVGDALSHILRCHRVICDAWAATQEVSGGVARLRRVERTPPAEAEAWIAFLVGRARLLTGRDLPPLEVRFPHAALADVRRYEAFFGCPVRFGAGASEILFQPELLEVPVKTANPGVEAVLVRYMDEMLARLPTSDSYVERVRSVVARTLRHGPPTLARTARELHASPRTVQRRLAEHGQCYADVVDSVRRPLAERLLREGRLSITEIAFLLGFVHVSGFRVAYKRWTGVAPSRGRRADHASDPT